MVRRRTSPSSLCRLSSGPVLPARGNCYRLAGAREGVAIREAGGLLA